MKKAILSVCILGMIFTTNVGVVNAEVKNSNGVYISDQNYKQLLKSYDENEINNMSYADVDNLTDPNIKKNVSTTKYIKIDEYTDCLGKKEYVETEIKEEDVNEEIANIALKNPSMSLCSLYPNTHSSSMKKMDIETYYNAVGTNKIVTMTNTWLSLPNVKSKDVIAIRFGAMDNLAILKADATYGRQIWDGNTISYSSTGDNTKIKTSGAADGKAGVGITMDLKDSVSSSLSNYLRVSYTSSYPYAYSVYGTYQHATSNVSSTNYTFSPTGYGNVIQFNSNASVYDQSSGVYVLGLK